MNGVAPESRFLACRQWDLFIGLLPLLAFLPLMLYQAAALWSREHMRFFPLALLFVFWLVIRNWSGAEETLHPVRKRYAIGIFLLSVLLYLISVWEFSPWLAHLAAIGAFTAWALGRFGQKHWSAILGWTSLFGTTLYLPWNWDWNLLNGLQTAAAWSTTRALDAIAIPGLQNGTLLETRGLAIVAEEVCGGLGNLFSYISFAVLLALFRHHSLIVAVSTIASVPVWALLSDFLRMFGILYLYEAWGYDLATGWDYRLLEMGTSLLVLALVMVTAAFFSRFYDPIPVADAEYGPIFSFMNRLFTWPQPVAFAHLVPKDEYERLRHQKKMEEREAQRLAFTEFHWTKNPTATWLVRLGVIGLLSGAVVPLGSLAANGLVGLQFGRPRLSATELEKVLKKDLFPEKLNGDWQLVDFQAQRRNPRSRLGEFGFSWVYRSAEEQMIASINLPFLGWHDPSAQQVLRGWRIEESSVVSQEDWPWMESVVQNELGGKAFLYHCLFTPQGLPYTAIPHADDDGSQAVSAAGSSNFGVATAVTYQFQLLREVGNKLVEEERNVLRETFLELRQIARNQGLATNQE